MKMAKVIMTEIVTRDLKKTWVRPFSIRAYVTSFDTRYRYSAPYFFNKNQLIKSYLYRNKVGGCDVLHSLDKSLFLNLPLSLDELLKMYPSFGPLLSTSVSSPHHPFSSSPETGTPFTTFSTTIPPLFNQSDIKTDDEENDDDYDDIESSDQGYGTTLYPASALYSVFPRYNVLFFIFLLLFVCLHIRTYRNCSSLHDKMCHLPVCMFPQIFVWLL
jgi:hypothetical protein